MHWRAPMARFLAAMAWCAASTVVLATSGCGAGLVAGVASANSGGGAPNSGAPAISVAAVLPLAPATGDRRTAVVANADFGGLCALGNRCDVPGLIPRSLILAPTPSGQVDRLVFLDRQSRVGSWLHDPAGAPVQPVEAMTPPLRELLADPKLAGAHLT
ncbi:MAG: hypothetical protein FJ306_11265, partial [Planctomycetes bacterium]|nr:hypothetical protein [Planctomycetota bacterium]